MNVAVVQWRPEVGDPSTNREYAREAIADAAEAGADLVVLPELFTVGYFAFDAWSAGAEPFDGPTHHLASDSARTYDIAILAGSFVEDLSKTESVDTPGENGLANTSILVDRRGDLVASYRKMHLCGYGSEEPERMVPGDTLGVGTIGEHTVGIATCYDLRFPELHRAYQDAGVTLMLVPSAWPTPRAEHWELLCRVRAMENQWYLAASNGCGEMGETALCGRSCVVDPWGRIVADLDENHGMVVASADRSEVDRIRAEFPILDDRRDDLSRS